MGHLRRAKSEFTAMVKCRVCTIVLECPINSLKSVSGQTNCALIQTLQRENRN